MSISRNNNFDLIRLLAALQVMIWHGTVHLEVFDNIYNFLYVLYRFPGVPIFFTISGFLISYSLERNNFRLKQYFKNRALRIYPALWICTIFTALLLIYFGKTTNPKQFVAWFLAQISFFQFYAPESLKNWGGGHPNGSLWSIAVELQFYVALPIVLYIVNLSKDKKVINFIIFGLFLFSVFCKLAIQNHYIFAANSVFERLLSNSVFMFLHFFLTGIAIYKNFDWLKKHLENKALIWLAIYAIYVIIFQIWLKYYDTPYEVSIWGIVANTLLSLLTISFAFSFTDLSKKMLHENDISYGIYIYHMPIVNAMMSLGMKGNNGYLVLAFIFTIIAAFLSWKFIEKKILAWKG